MIGSLLWSPNRSEYSAVRVLGWSLVIQLFNNLVTVTSLDTCGRHFYFPAFPHCHLLLEAIPCFSPTGSVLVTIETREGELVHRFNISLETRTRLSLLEVNKHRLEGLVIRSESDISLYLHQTSGDSMVLHPIHLHSRDYDIPPLTSQGDLNETSHNGSDTATAVYLFSSHKNTTVVITSILPECMSSSSLNASFFSSPCSLSTNIVLDPFDIQVYYLEPERKFHLRADNEFAVVLIHTDNLLASDEMVCVNSTLILMDFVPGRTVKGTTFVLPSKNVFNLTMFIMGPENTSVEVTSDHSHVTLRLDHTEITSANIQNSSLSWVLTSHPVTVYVKMTICRDDGSLPDGGKICADSGYFLPSVQHYFTCRDNSTTHPVQSTPTPDSTCVCPSLFQRHVHATHYFFLSSNSSDQNAHSPLQDDEHPEVALFICKNTNLKHVTDVIVSTNNSFQIFRTNLLYLNQQPAGFSVPPTHVSCTPDPIMPPLPPGIEPDRIEFKYREVNNLEISEYEVQQLNQCSQQLPRGLIGKRVSVKDGGFGGATEESQSLEPEMVGQSSEQELVWVEEEEDSTRPLIAVVVSLCVSIFAVIALISGYMLVELMTRRKHVRNTKIRPFLS